MRFDAPESRYQTQGTILFLPNTPTAKNALRIICRPNSRVRVLEVLGGEFRDEDEASTGVVVVGDPSEAAI